MSTTPIHCVGYDCVRDAFRVELCGRDYLDRESAITAALNILSIASLFGGLSEAQRARLDGITVER